ncbi:MAG: PAS domain S-box protein, partial [Proteobacteria bacterium]
MGLYEVAASLFVFAIMMSGGILLNAYGHSLAARFYQPILFVVAVAVEVFLVGVHGGLTQLFIPGIAFAFLLFDHREKKLLVRAIAITTAISIFATIAAQKYSPIFKIVDSSHYPVLRVISWVVTLSLLLGELFLFFRSVETSRMEVRTSHQVANTILEANTDSVLFIGPDFRIKYINPPVREDFKTLGFPNVIGMDFFEISKILQSSEILAPLHDAILQQKSYHHEFLEPNFRVWYEVRATPGRHGTSVSFRNVDERKKKEVALVESELMQRAILTNAGAGISVLNASGFFMRVNPAMLRFTGYSESELLGQNFARIVLKDEEAAFLQDLKKFVSGEIDSLSDQKRYTHKDGRIIYGLVQV